MTAAIDRSHTTLTPLHCARCGGSGTGAYCAQCGTQLGGPRDLSVKHFLKEAAQAITDLDSALIGSFRVLVTRPGTLTLEYMHGNRHRFLPPFRVFLLCNLLYFVAVAQFKVTVLTAPLQTQLAEMTYRRVTQAIIAKRYHLSTSKPLPEERASRDSTRAVIRQRYDGATEGIAKTILVVLIPLYALMFQILYIGRRRFFAEHLVFSTHLVAFLLLAIPAVGLAVRGYNIISIFALERFLPPGETLYAVALAALFSVYAFQAQRVVYQAGRAAAFVRTTVLAVTLVEVIVAFKFVLFLVTLYWIS